MMANVITGIRILVSAVLNYSGIPICSVATFAAIQEGHFIRTGKEIKT